MSNFIFFLLCFIGVSVIGQNQQVLYEFDELPQTLKLNPGSHFHRSLHIGVPLLSHIHAGAGSTGISFYDIFQDGGNINTRIRKKIHEMKSTDFVTTTLQIDLLDFGWRAYNGTYFSGGVYQELDLIVYFPRDLAILVFEGNKDYLGKNFDLGQISTRGDITTVYHFGMNRQVSRKLTIGGRLKVYNSMLSFQSVDNRGSLTTRQGKDNIYEHLIENADVTINTSGFAPIRDSISDNLAGDIFGRTLFGGNMGLGLDLGLTYDFNDSWSITASALDIGMIFHNKDVESYHGYGSYELEGIDFKFPRLGKGEATIPYYEILEDDIDKRIIIDTGQQSYIQFRPARINAGLSYGFGRYNPGDGCNFLRMAGRQYHKHIVGVQYYSIFRPKGLQVAGTVFYSRKFNDHLTAKATYTADPFSLANLGLGVSTHIGKVNLYVAADNLLRYGNLAKAKHISLQLGINLQIDEG